MKVIHDKNHTGLRFFSVPYGFILFFNKTIRNRFISCEPLGSQEKAQRAFEEAVQYQSWAKHRLCPAQQMLRIKRLFSSVLLKIGINCGIGVEEDLFHKLQRHPLKLHNEMMIK